MKTQRTFASFCLAMSCCALITATSVSVGDQPGVVRLTSGQETITPPVPVPPASEDKSAPTDAPINAPVPHNAPVPQADYSLPPNGPIYSPQMPMAQGAPAFYSPQPDYTPYFQQSAGATESPVIGRRPYDNPLFGPTLMFESNIGEGLGFGESFHRLNARIPHHVVPGSSVLAADLSASVSDNNRNLYNLGAYWRNYDALRNRIFGWNAYWDMDDGRGNKQWNRIGVGMESLGKYVDFRLNGYIVQGDESVLLTDELVGNLVQTGNTVTRIRNQSRDNAYSGADFEVGGPLPILGRRGINAYTGAYWLDSEYGYDTVGFSARFQAMVTESATVNLTLTNDDTFGTNSWVSVSYAIPNYGERRIFQPKCVRDRLADPVHRSNRVHSNIDAISVPEAVINPKTGVAWNLIYVDPNAGGPGTGTFEDPYGTLQLAANNNNAAIDVIQVRPRADDTTTNLTLAGGIDLFDCQALVTNVKDYTLFTQGGQNFVLPGVATATNLGPLISDPNMVAGGSLIRLANENTIFGLRLDASNTANTAFGTGILNPLPITDARIICNTFTGYETAIDLQDVSGNVTIDENTIDGTSGVSNNGLLLTTANGSMTNLLVRNNVVNDNTNVGVSITANPGATINADDPNGVASPIPTGIVNNNVTTSGTGIEVIGLAGATINAVVNGNTSSNNTGTGFIARADGAMFTLASLSGNTFDTNAANGAFLHYLNGGTMFAVTEEVNEDLNFNGTLDPGEDLDLDGVLDVPDGLLAAAEDLNGNGLLDQGIVSNTFSNNTVAGLRIFGEGSGTGAFDIGGQQAGLGNAFLGNTVAGIDMDLTGTATAQTNTMNNEFRGGSLTSTSLTFVIDFLEPFQGTSTDPFGTVVNPFDITAFGLAAADFNTLTGMVRDTVEAQFLGIPTVGVDPRSPIPDGMELDIDFVIGDVGVAPSNGATEFYTIVIGEGPPGSPLGVAAGDIVRDINGVGPNFGAMNGDHVATTFSDVAAVSSLPIFIPGNITQTTNLLANITSHEIGHTVSLNHVDPATSVTPSGIFPIMAAFADPAADVTQLEFSFSGVASGFPAPGAPLNNVQQLVSAVGLRSSTPLQVSGDGININLADTARLLPSNIINNTIEQNQGTGVQVVANDSARVEGLTIQGNTIQNNVGRGIDLVANGAMAFIDASNTIGGEGNNILDGMSFTEANTITSNQGDGIRAFAENGGTILGNALNNTITNNTGNGIALHIETAGTLDFGTLADNRRITGNTITGNGGVGIELISNVTAATQGRIDAVVRNNTINQNAGGGIVSTMTGPNMMGLTNNVVDLTVGGTAAQANTIVGNTNVGVGFSVAGNGLGMLTMSNASVTGTLDGADPLTDGDAINLQRQDSSLLIANIDTITATGNAGDGLDVDVQGNDKNDPNQPNTGVVNSVTWSNNTFSNNGESGASFRVRGDAQLIADGTSNTVTDNTENGIIVNTSETASFGDPTNGLPPGQRVMFDGTTATGNGVDGVQLIATEDSRVLTEITGTVANGNTTISNNGRDGVRVTTTGGLSDILLTSGTGTTTISGNGTAAGGNGVRWDASGTSDGIVRATNITISDNIAGQSEDVNGNGVLDAGEDLNGNGDIDVAEGDGIQYNVTGTATSTLIVGGVGEGNVIQNNGDDGIAITATGTTGVISRPIISLVENTIGGDNMGVLAGNTGDGVSMNIFGQSLIGTGTLNGTAGVQGNGPIVQLTMTDNGITNNGQRGANLLMHGAAGERNRENGAAIVDPVRITMTGNNISSNGTEGIFFRGDSDTLQNRVVGLPNPPDGMGGFIDNTNFNPNRFEFTSLNIGSVNANTAYQVPYLNLRTVQNTLLTVTGNTIQSNGVGTVTGEGMFIEVGTGSYLAADVRNNQFGGNLDEDFHTESFLSAGETALSTDVNNAPLDFVPLDDTAQFDLRFSNNVGNQINVTSTGATYTQNDLLKQPFAGVTRDAFLFQVDDGMNLDNPNNTFINFGITQDIDAAFSSGGYGLRAGADFAFPNIGFAPILP